MPPVQIPDVILRTVGRACAGPLAVVLHEYNSGIESLDAQMNWCPRPRPAQSPGCHTSYHYGIGGGTFHQYVALANTAWGFGVTPPTCPEPICPPDVCESCTGLTQDQFNADVDGNLPTLPVGWTVAGPDGTANCRAIHVAVTSLFPTNQQLGSGPCCDPNASAYNSLLEALCEIFTAAGLVASQSTLLVHCGEHVCLDIDQLVTDVLAFDCAPVTVSPCINCPPSTGALEDVDGTPLVDGDEVITPSNLFDAAVFAGVTPPSNLLIAPVIDGDAPQQLLAPPALLCTLWPGADNREDDSANFNAGYTVLAMGPNSVLRWRLLGAGFTAGGDVGAGAINVNGAESGVRYVSTDGNMTINRPSTSCARTEIYIKNVDVAAITVTGTAVTIDGAAFITLVANEAAHLVWNEGRAEWQRF